MTKEEKIKEIQNSIISILPELKESLNSKLEGVTPFYGKTFYDERFLGNDQETQDCTKDFQYLATATIAEVAAKNGIPLYQKEVDGADWVYGDGELNIQLLEQKIRTFLLRSKNSSKFIKKYGLPCQSWTGNKSSVYNGKKTDLHLLWSFGIEKSKISKIGCVLLSLEENETQWTTGSGKTDSYATLRINKNPKGVYLIEGSLHSTHLYNYLLLNDKKIINGNKQNLQYKLY
jgi:hypothetical protein